MTAAMFHPELTSCRGPLGDHMYALASLPPFSPVRPFIIFGWHTQKNKQLVHVDWKVLSQVPRPLGILILGGLSNSRSILGTSVFKPTVLDIPVIGRGNIISHVVLDGRNYSFVRANYGWNYDETIDLSLFYRVVLYKFVLQIFQLLIAQYTA